MLKILILIFALFHSFAFGFEVQKPQIYDDQNITSWLMSEKLDGIRGYWDGKEFYSKNGNKLNVPDWFIKDFPPFPLDGELWSKRNDFEFIQSTVLDTHSSNEWKKITYNIFEVPNAKGDFSTRLQKAKEWFLEHQNPHVNIIKQIVCKDEYHLQGFLDEIIALKGEGVVIKMVTFKYYDFTKNGVPKFASFLRVREKE
ncbi:MAG: hypothetical protein HY307_00580 [Arcobacter sp.]|nr:hypothetical protein [Arcobacter sp.]